MTRLSHLKALTSGIAIATALSATPILAQGADTLVIARSMDINSLDPARAFCDTCQIVMSALYDRLVDLGSDNKTVEPLLAKSWTVSEDMKVFTFTLAEGIQFADGTPITTDDIIWSLMRLKNLKGTPSFIMDGVSSVEAPDEKTIVITLTSPDSEFLNKMTGYATGILNRKIAEANGARGGEDAATTDQSEAWFLANSAGAGPFTLARYSPDEELRLAANSAYWGAGGHFQEVVFRQTQDAVSQAQLLASGGADIAMQIDPITASSVVSPDIIYEIVPSYNFLYVGLSQGPKGENPQLNSTLREAISLAINYDEMLEFTVNGEGAKQATAIPNGFPGTKDLPLRSEDLDRARALLAEAGYPDGFTVEAIYPADNIYGVDINTMMQKVQQDLSRVGITVNLSPSTYPVWRDKLNGEGIAMTAVYYAPDYYGSSQYPQYFAMIEGSAWKNRASKNGEDLSSPKQAELLAKALSSMGEAQEAAFTELGLEMMKDNVILPMVSPNLVMAYRSDIEGVRYSACCNLPLDEIKRK